jgi:hypothetical protein
VVEKTVRRAGRAWYISNRRCEDSPDPSEVSSLGKLSVFSKSPIGTLGVSFITVLKMLSRDFKALTILFAYEKILGIHGTKRRIPNPLPHNGGNTKGGS